MCCEIVRRHRIRKVMRYLQRISGDIASHLWEMSRQLFPLDLKHHRRFVRRRQKQLDEGRVEHLVPSLRDIHAETPELDATMRVKTAYVERHAEGVRNTEFRRPGRICLSAPE